MAPRRHLTLLPLLATALAVGVAGGCPQGDLCEGEEFRACECEGGGVGIERCLEGRFEPCECPSSDGDADVDADSDGDGHTDGVGASNEWWEFVGDLYTGGYNGQAGYLGVLDGWIYGFPGGADGYHRWQATDARHVEHEWAGWADGDYEQCGTCQVDDRLYFLGGGGNGVFSPWADYHYEVADLTWRTWDAGGEHSAPYHAPGVTGDGERCYVVAGNRGGGMQPTGAVQVFDPGAGAWSALRPLPVAVLYPAAAVVEGLLVVAGGGRQGEASEAGTHHGVAIPDVWTNELDIDGAEWSSGPELPLPLLDAGAIAFEGRAWLMGGVTNTDVEPQYRSEVWSWAPGEPAWQEAGLLPEGRTSPEPVVVDGELFVVTTAQGDQYHSELYRHVNR